jgi:hypothetical protein
MYGKCSSGLPAADAAGARHDAIADVAVHEAGVTLPFDPSEIAANLRLERYAFRERSAHGRSSILKTAYYLTRPFLGVPLRKHLQRLRLRGWDDIQFPRWPVDVSVDVLFERLLGFLLQVHGVGRIPFIWFWPEGFESCVMMTHDVETRQGLTYCSHLMDLDEGHGIKSSFQIVPEGRYPVPSKLLATIRERGFEINVHDLNHDGRLFDDERLFLERAVHINRYGKEFGARGFRSAILYRNPAWLDTLEFEYDMSIPTSGHLEAQQGGCCSVLPFFLGSILELPVTTTQDYSLFHILKDYSIDVWKRQLETIERQHGLASFIIHPDYLMEPRAGRTYECLLAHLGELKASKRAWFALPGEVNRWWRERNAMTLVRRRGDWEIEGIGKDRARVAYATLQEDRVIYSL